MKNFVLTTILALSVLFGFSFTPCFAGQAVRATRLIVSADPIQPVGDYLVFGANQTPLLNLRFTSTGGDIVLTDFFIEDTMIQGDFSHLGTLFNFALYDQYGVRVGANVGFPNSLTNPLRMPVHFNAPLLIARNNSVTLRLMADMPQYGANPFSHKSIHMFGVSEKGFFALNKQTNELVSVVFAYGVPPVSEKFMVVRSMATFRAQGVGSTENRVLSTSDRLADIVVGANSAGPIVVTDITLTFSGNFPFSEGYFARYASLYASWGGRLDTDEPFTYKTKDGRWGVCFRFTHPYVVPAGVEVPFGLCMNTQAASDGSQQQKSITIDVTDRTDVGYLDSLDPNTAATLCLPLGVTPKHIATVTYASGQ